LENSIKKFKIIENPQNITNIVLIFRICGVKVSKIQVEREGDVGGWWVMPSSFATPPLARTQKPCLEQNRDSQTQTPKN